MLLNDDNEDKTQKEDRKEDSGQIKLNLDLFYY